MSALLVASALATICPASRASSADAAPLPRMAMDAAQAYSRSQGEKALLIEQHGAVLVERYARGVQAATKHKLYSGTKLYWCLALLAAADDGLLELDAPVRTLLPAVSEGLAKVTLRELMDFSAGLAPAFELHRDGLQDRDAIALRAPLVAARGDSFIYGPAGLQVAHAALARALSRQGERTTHYLERRVLAPLHLGPQRYLPDKTGHPLLAAGFTQTPREWLRMGRLIMRHGEGVVSARRFGEATSGSDACHAFGFGIWNNRAASRSSAHAVDVEATLHLPWQQQTWAKACLSKTAPSDLLACIGSHGQRLYVVPSRGLIIVRLAESQAFDDARFLGALFARSR